MEIRPEAKRIMLAFGIPTTELHAGTREESLAWINSMDSFDSSAWQPMPLTALVQAYTNVLALPSDPLNGVEDAVANYLAETPPAPLVLELHTPLLTAVDEASESYFTAAREDFDSGDTVSGTQNLCYAANCAVIGQAAIHGWAHATDDDDVRAIVALATGTLPQNPGDVYNLLMHAPSDGMDLSSNHGAVKSVHQAALGGYFFENGYTTELATSFAQTAADLAKRLGIEEA